MFSKEKFDGPYDCPYTNFTQKCRKDKCPKWIHIQGAHPQTGVAMDYFDCADRWVPVLLVNVANMSRETGAAIESARNAARRDAEALVSAVLTRPMMFDVHGTLVETEVRKLAG